MAVCTKILTNKEFCVLHVQSNTTFILPINTVRIQLHVSVLYVDHLQVEMLTYRLDIQDVWGVWMGGGLGGRDLVVSIVGTMVPSY